MQRSVRLLLSLVGLLLAGGLVLALEGYVQGAGVDPVLPDVAWTSADLPRSTDLAEAAAPYPGSQVTLGDAGAALSALAAGDLDRDGQLDLVSTGLLAWRNVYPSPPFGSSWPSATIASGVDASDVALGDLDQDGDLDVVACGTFGLAIWQNPWDGGSGTVFATWPVSHVLAAAQSIVNEVVVADLDHDGWLDIGAVRGYHSSEGWLAVWHNPGAFTGAWMQHTVSTVAGYQALAAADLDHDGWTDLVTGSGLYAPEMAVRAWRNDHSPFSGSWASRLVVDVGDDVNGLALADLDGDGWVDIAAGYEEDTWGRMGVWRNPGNPFDASWSQSVSMNALARVGALAAGDLDHDGDVDVASVSLPSGNEVCWWENDGSPFTGDWLCARTSGEGMVPHDVLLADLDGDGDLDTAASGETLVVAWPNGLRKRGMPSPSAGLPVGDPPEAVYALAAGDLDWDGDEDLVSTGLRAWRNPYPSTFLSRWSSAHLEAGIEAWDAALADMDHDGDLDVVAGGQFGVAVWENPWNGGSADPFTSWPVRRVLTTSQVLVFQVAVADLDRDGWPDVAAVRGGDWSDGWLCAWRNPHDLSAPWTGNVITRTPGLEVLEAADLDRDGWVDLVTGSGLYAYDLEVRAWRNDRTPFAGGWSSHQVVQTWPLIGDDVRDIKLADLDRDGLTDIVARFDEQTWGRIGMWRNPGDPFAASWSTSVLANAGARTSAIIAGDLDRDGDVDVVDVDSGASTPPVGGIRWWENDGSPFDAPWSNRQASVPGTGLLSVLLADLDKDGGPDVVAGGTGGPKIRAWPSSREPSTWLYPVREVLLGGAGDTLSAIAAADLEGDGDVDLVSDGVFAWENPYTATFAAPWLSATLAAGAQLNDVALSDLDLDGDPDLVGGGDFGLAVWQNPMTQSASTPFGAWPISYVLSTTVPVQALAVVDLDDDDYPDIAAARDDLLVAGGSGDLYVWQNPGSPFGAAWTSNQLSGAQGIHALAVGDLDGDLRPDLVSGSAYPGPVHEVRVWRNDGTPFGGVWASYQVRDVASDGLSSDVNSVAVAHLDGDGRLDLVAGYETATAGTVAVWQNLGSPFNLPWTAVVTMTAGGRVWRVAAGDLDLDGHVDVVSAASFSYTGNELTWWHNDGSPFDGVWASAWRVEPWLYDLLLADLDRDGAPETVAIRQGSSQVVAWKALLERSSLPIVARGAAGP